MEAEEARENEDYEKAAEILSELAEEMPDNTRVLFLLGYNLHASGKLDEAIKYHMKAAESDIDEFKILGLYNLACAYSLKNEKDKAFDYLKQSIKAGYVNPDQVAHAKRTGLVRWNWK